MNDDRVVPAWIVMITAAIAGGMGWGIRGQYGHETGAMIAGLLVALVLVLMLCPRADSLFSARAVAMCALGISIGGSMTYGRTLGLTQNANMIGNFEALRWGLLGVAIKGGIWIGLAAAFLGMALSEVRYRPVEIALLLFGLIFLQLAGVQLLNQPFNPSEQILPKIHFSSLIYFDPEGEFEPRREGWGGLLAALAGLYVYTAIFRGDRLVRWLALWGIAGGALGFATGQSLQAWHAWNTEAVRQSWFGEYDELINYWNMMETTFGAIAGAALGLGLWVHRRAISNPGVADPPEINPVGEWLLVAVHVAAVVAWNFGMFGTLDRFAGLATTMVVIPMVAVAAGRWWPYLVALPIVTVPIAGKTFRGLALEREEVPVLEGAVIYVAVPVVVTLAVAVWLVRAGTRQRGSAGFASVTLLVMTWVLFALNFAFFDFPWPWEEWTSRTPNGLIFFVCALGLTAAAIFVRGPADPAAASPAEAPGGVPPDGLTAATE